MKLLRSETEYFAWMREGDVADGGDPVSDDGLRVHGPTAYPCYAYWHAVPEDDPELLFLYFADVDDMWKALWDVKASPAQGTV